MSSSDLSLSDALALVRDATQAEHVALRAARDVLVAVSEPDDEDDIPF